MSSHTSTIAWRRGDARFTDNRYSRAHQWSFDGGLTVPASASPQVVPLPLSVAAAVDPEEAFVAALASCHMLWFLSIAARRQYLVDDYRDEAVGTLARNEAGQEVMANVTLRPHVVFSGPKAPTDAEVEALHHEAHRSCYLANSVKTAVEARGTWSRRLAAAPAGEPAA
jgi:organic hydroperoxide reductase OsmC/OhrA